MVPLWKESIVLSWRSDRLVSCFPYLWIQQATIWQPPSWRHLLSSSLPVFTCLSEKTGCASANSSGKNFVFPLVFAFGFPYLFIRQDAPRQIPRGKLRFPLVFALGFHYLFIRQDAPRQTPRGKTSFSPSSLRSAFTIFATDARMYENSSDAPPVSLPKVFPLRHGGTLPGNNRKIRVSARFEGVRRTRTV